MNKSNILLRIYRFFLPVGVLLCLIGLIIVPINTYDSSTPSYGIEITPTDCIQVDSITREFYLRGITWDSSASCLRFSTSHQEVSVTADGTLLLERKTSNGLYGHTPGAFWNFVEIPSGTSEIVVTIRACYANVANTGLTFYQGTGAAMQQVLLRDALFSSLISLLNIFLGFAMLIYWVLAHKKTQIGNTVLYLGIFAVLLGTWSFFETDVAKLLFSNRVGCSFISYTMLMMISIPFMWFFHDYLHDSNRFLCPVLTALSLAEILLVMVLHFTGIADLRSTLTLSHIMMVLAVLYIFITLGSKLRTHAFQSEIRVSVIGLLILTAALTGDLISYYLGARDVDAFGRLGFFIFILALGMDASSATFRDIEAGRKAMIYKELAEKDMLTNCYNRNAYLSDTAECKLEDGLLLVTFDLNNLKYYNDTFGHACGDQYLMDSVSIMQNVFGTLGKLYRVGGDEFCVLIPSQEKVDMNLLIDAFTREQGLYNDLPDGQIHLQIACGYAYYDSRNDSSLEATLKRADDLMYENKRAQKGCAPR